MLKACFRGIAIILFLSVCFHFCSLTLARPLPSICEFRNRPPWATDLLAEAQPVPRPPD